MNKANLIIFHLFILGITVFCLGQTIESFESTDSETKKGLFDPSRFSINHSVSFGMSSSTQTKGLKSQSLYSSMMTYKFSQPLTLNLNFSLPIHSTYSPEFNLNQRNIESLEYFKSLPFDASIHWQPSENFSMSFSISRNVYDYSYINPYSLFYGQPFMRPQPSKEKKSN